MMKQVLEEVKTAERLISRLRHLRVLLVYKVRGKTLLVMFKKNFPVYNVVLRLFHFSLTENRERVER